jgi:hypothetical protein
MTGHVQWTGLDTSHRTTGRTGPISPVQCPVSIRRDDRSGSEVIEASVIRQVLEACESARTFHGYSIEEWAARAHMSARMLRYIRAGRPTTLRRLAAVAGACGFELSINVRLTRATVVGAGTEGTSRSKVDD